MTTRRLAVALLSHVASPAAPSGAERSLALLAGSLAARGHRVCVVTPGPWALAADVGGRGVEVHTVPLRCCWLTYHERRPTVVAALKWARFAIPDPGRRRLQTLLRRWKPDVAVVNCLPHVRAATASRSIGLPVVWYVREILPAGWRRRYFATRLARNAQRAVAVSEAVGRWLREEGLRERLRVIPNGVPLPTTRPDAAQARRDIGVPAGGCLVGLCGQLRPHKGILEFVRAARLALREEPTLIFALAGAGPDGFLRRVRQEIGAGSLAERFHWVPPQPSAEQFIAASDVVCLATRTPDPLPRSVLEAMAGGRPVAAFRSGGTEEMVVDGVTGLLSGPGDVPALAALLVRLGRDAALRRSMGEAGARRARDLFSLERHVERVEEVLREAIS